MPVQQQNKNNSFIHEYTKKLLLSLIKISFNLYTTTIIVTCATSALDNII